MAIKYIEFTRAKDEFTEYFFVNKFDEDTVKLNNFTGIDRNIVSIVADDEDTLETLVNLQDSKIEATEITYADFRSAVKDSLQVKRINNVVKEKIAEKYDYADEIKLLKEDETNDERIAYEGYVDSCKEIGNDLKREIGYLVDEG